MLFAGSAIMFALVLWCSVTTAAQATNSISGRVYGVDRRPISDLNIELLDDLGRTIARTQTNGSGSYEFRGLSGGTFTVRVYTFGTDYEEQENRVEIQNIEYQTSRSQTKAAGFSREMSDFNLKLRKGVQLQNTALFAQDVPAEARKLYEKGIEDLSEKNTAQGLAELRHAVEIFPKYYAALERLGTEYVKMGTRESLQAAEIVLATAVQVNPRGFKSWYGMAYAEYVRGEYSEALAAIQKADELNSSSPEASVLYGILLRRAGKYQDAEKQLLKAKDAAKGTMPRIYWELALLYGKDMKRYSDAAKELKLFLQNTPEAKDAENIKKLIAEFESKAKEQHT